MRGNNTAGLPDGAKLGVAAAITSLALLLAGCEALGIVVYDPVAPPPPAQAMDDADEAGDAESAASAAVGEPAFAVPAGGAIYLLGPGPGGPSVPETSMPVVGGMDAERLDRITEMTQRYVDEGKLAGVITLVARGGNVVHFEAVGQRGAEDDRPLEKDALFRIFSMTKPITAVAAMMLYEEGKFQLSDPVSKFVPELKDLKVLNEDGEMVPAEKTMTMHHLLTHTAGFSYGFNPQGDPVDKLYVEANLWQSEDLDDFAERLAKLPLKFEPGDQWHYSVAVDVTGLVIERISGQRFDVFLKERVFDPLGMVDTFFNVPEDKMDRFLPNHGWNAEEEKLVQMGEETFVSYTDTEFFSGGGGLVSTTGDYLRFCEMLRRGGLRLLSPKTIEFMTQDHLPAALSADSAGENPLLRGIGSFGFGLGFGVNTDVPSSGVLGSVGEYAWGGAAGTIFWVDPAEDMVVIGMIQLMGSPWPLRSELKVLANQAIASDLWCAFKAEGCPRDLDEVLLLKTEIQKLQRQVGGR